MIRNRTSDDTSPQCMAQLAYPDGYFGARQQHNNSNSNSNTKRRDESHLICHQRLNEYIACLHTFKRRDFLKELKHLGNRLRTIFCESEFECKFKIPDS